MFFHTMTPNIALTEPANTELIGCLEGRELKNVWSSWQRIQSFKAINQSPKIILELSSQVPSGRIFDRLKFTRFGALFTRNHFNRAKKVRIVRNL